MCDVYGSSQDTCCDDNSSCQCVVCSVKTPCDMYKKTTCKICTSKGNKLFKVYLPSEGRYLALGVEEYNIQPTTSLVPFSIRESYPINGFTSQNGEIKIGKCGGGLYSLSFLMQLIPTEGTPTVSLEILVNDDIVLSYSTILNTSSGGFSLSRDLILRECDTIRFVINTTSDSGVIAVGYPSTLATLTRVFC